MEKILCVYCGDLFDSLKKAIGSERGHHSSH